MSQRTTTSPAILTLQMHNYTVSWEGPWDSDLNALFNAFIGLCSTVGFANKDALKNFIYKNLDEELGENYLENLE